MENFISTKFFSFINENFRTKKFHKLILIYALFLFCYNLNAQSKYYKEFPGVSATNFPITESTPDGGFIIAAGDYQTNKTQLIKYDQCGEMEWSKYFLLFGVGDLIICGDGCILLCSSYRALPFLLKLDKNGNVLWCNSYSCNAGNYSDYVYSAGEFPNGDLFINGIISLSGTGPYYNFVIKTDLNGNIKWSNYYFQQGYRGYAIACNDGGVLGDAGRGIKFKTDSLGNLEWSNYYPSTYSKPIELNDGFVFTYVDNADTSFIYKIDKLGNFLWSGDRFQVKNISEIKRLKNGNFVMIGSYQISPNQSKAYPVIIETDSVGHFVKEQSYNQNFFPIYYYYGGNFCLMDNGSLVFSGISPNRLFVAKTGINREVGCGDSIFSKHFAPTNINITNCAGTKNNLGFTKSSSYFNLTTNNPAEQIYCSGYDSLNFELPPVAFVCKDSTLLLKAPAGNYSYLWSTGDTSITLPVAHPGRYDVRIIDRCINDTITSSVRVFPCHLTTGIENDYQNNMVISPNPSPGKFMLTFKNTNFVDNNLQCKIYNYLGDCVYYKIFKIFNGELTEVIDLSSQAAGVYFIEIIADSKTIVRKIVLE